SCSAPMSFLLLASRTAPAPSTPIGRPAMFRTPGGRLAAKTRREGSRVSFGLTCVRLVGSSAVCSSACRFLAAMACSTSEGGILMPSLLLGWFISPPVGTGLQPIGYACGQGVLRWVADQAGRRGFTSGLGCCCGDEAVHCTLGAAYFTSLTI